MTPILLAQGEAVLITKALEELSKSKDSSSNGLYVFALVIVIIGCGAFYVLRYMLAHTREITKECHTTISGLSERFHESTGRLTDSFRSECQEQREQHHTDQERARDMVHATRDIAATSVNSKEFIDKLRTAETGQMQTQAHTHKRPGG